MQPSPTLESPRLNRTLPAWFIIFGSALGMLALVMHPVGGSLERLAHVAPVTRLAHGVALLSLVAVWIGLLTQALERPSRATRHTALLQASAVALLTLSGLAVLGAGTLNGFIVPSIAEAFRNRPQDLSTVEAIIASILIASRTLTSFFVLSFCGALLVSAPLAWPTPERRWLSLGSTLVSLTTLTISFAPGFLSIPRLFAWGMAIPLMWLVVANMGRLLAERRRHDA